MKLNWLLISLRFFRRSRNNYGTRKIKQELKKMGQQVSRRRISRIMKQEALYRIIPLLNLSRIQLNVTKITLKISWIVTLMNNHI